MLFIAIKQEQCAHLQLAGNYRVTGAVWCYYELGTEISVGFG